MAATSVDRLQYITMSQSVLPDTEEETSDLVALRGDIANYLINALEREPLMSFHGSMIGSTLEVLGLTHRNLGHLERLLSYIQHLGQMMETSVKLHEFHHDELMKTASRIRMTLLSYREQMNPISEYIYPPYSQLPGYEKLQSGAIILGLAQLFKDKNDRRDYQARQSAVEEILQGIVCSLRGPIAIALRRRLFSTSGPDNLEDICSHKQWPLTPQKRNNLLALRLLSYEHVFKGPLSGTVDDLAALLWTIGWYEARCQDQTL
ncbi:hypothetical protein TREMEDRAFT_64793 [Tremella mesenterica DSM 1558]|uniref:uncharacterized protein n=1 Tax=Tremella mesenterica (strain ATCC 24925 / CBS 8224 / DSM 1558 / NBRC 9311 / NRRL Y-6157 / RJB 2259-6 / UBC 559-6) TaxID=578456 RepID=UPI0003F4A5D8|nr:uncharacterized protein TREMEDRAFT_64793 [Tremella mesenterica DSM 1558]EIW66938.1 hypothetical protein TREMEDRAFT_64793 [Tremella mesenterica DSM 1558]